jgi:ABC-type bacteriocin/lantibiotic exporter with double-glycine peptidase domain
VGRVGWVLILVALWATAAPGPTWAAPAGRWLEVPHRTQLDGSPYQRSNCGPAAMAMVLAFHGRPVSTTTLRGQVNDLQGTWGNYESGTAIRSLVVIAARHGLRPLGAYNGAAVRRWTLDELREQLDAGHPVIAEVWYRGLPGRRDSAYAGDHFIVVVGYTESELIYNDPVDQAGGRRIGWRQFDVAWRSGDLVRAAVAVAGEEDEPVVEAEDEAEGLAPEQASRLLGEVTAAVH